MTDAKAQPVPYERASFVLAGLALLGVFLLHLVPAVLAGFLAWMVLEAAARRLRGGRVSHSLARALAAGLLGLVAAAVAAAAIVLIVGFVRGRIGDLPSVVETMADTLGRLREAAAMAGIPLPASGEGGTGDVGAWLKEHAGALKHAGSVGMRGFLHAILGAVAGVLVFFGATEPTRAPLGAALEERATRFGECFRSVAKAQIAISGVNTVLTALFLFVVLPLFGVHLPVRGSLVAITFLCGLIPVAGNLLSNTVVVLVALGVSPWAAGSALAFLVVVHKLEYVLNARIVGGHIGASAWETLLAIVVFEAAFGISGVILAPVVYAWVKGELTRRKLV